MTAPGLSGSLFSGAGGLDMAVEAVFGTRTVFVSDIDPGAVKALAYRFPDAVNLGDIAEVEWGGVPRVRVLGGGFPCQDVSSAGPRRGLMDGTRSGLWSEMARAIEELRPEFVVIENVRGLLSADGEPWHPDLIEAQERVEYLTRMETLAATRAELAREESTRGRYRAAAVRIARQRERAVRVRDRERRLVRRAIDTVLRDLADLGFDALWEGVRASDLGAPHQRFRVFVLAWPRPGVRHPGHDAGGAERGVESAIAAGGAGEPGAVAAADAGGLAVGERARGASAEEAGSGRGHRPGDRGGARPAGVRRPADADPEGGRRRVLDAEHVWPPRREVNAPGDDRDAGERGAGAQAHVWPPADAGRFARVAGWPAAPGEATGGGALGRAAGCDSSAPDTERSGWERGEAEQYRASADSAGGHLGHGAGAAPSSGVRWGPYEEAVRRWEAVLGRPAPAPTEPTGLGGAHRLSPAFTEWMMGWPEGWVTDPAVGLTRPEQLKRCGDGVVPQQAAWAIRRMLAIRAALLGEQSEEARA